jgi:hypothetical protein
MLHGKDHIKERISGWIGGKRQLLHKLSVGVLLMRQRLCAILSQLSQEGSEGLLPLYLTAQSQSADEHTGHIPEAVVTSATSHSTKNHILLSAVLAHKDHGGGQIQGVFRHTLCLCQLP